MSAPLATIALATAPHGPSMSVAAVIHAYVAITGVGLDDLAGTAKTPSIARPRHELMFILRRLTPASHSAIGRYLGGRDMATVHAGVANIVDRLARDADYRSAVNALIDQILSRRPRAPAPDGWERIAALFALRDPRLTDAEARKVAITLLDREAPHGA